MKIYILSDSRDSECYMDIQCFLKLEDAEAQRESMGSHGYFFDIHEHKVIE